MVVVIITLSLQTCVSGAHGASGRRARTRVAVGSGSATGGPWPLHQALAARASRRRARAATRDSAQVRPLTSSHFVRFRRAVTKTLGVCRVCESGNVSLLQICYCQDVFGQWSLLIKKKMLKKRGGVN